MTKLIFLNIFVVTLEKASSLMMTFHTLLSNPACSQHTFKNSLNAANSSAIEGERRETDS